MNATFRRLQVVCAMTAVTLTSVAHAVEVTTWRTFRGTDSTATVVDSGQGTNDPVFGNTTTTSQASRIIGYFDPLTLVDVGDEISLTYTVSFNDANATGMNTSSGDNWRYALFGLNGEAPPAAENIAANGSSDTNGFLGYWAGVKTGAGAGAAGSLRERFDTSNNDMFANATATDNLVTPPIDGTNITFAGLINGAGTPTLYTGEFTITKTAAGVDLSGSFSGNGGENTFLFSETTPISLTYGAVGFLNGGGMSADQVIFQDVNATYTPVASAEENADFDGDGDVDGADFLTWQRGVGTAGGQPQGNADGLGDIDGADLAIWEAEFGMPQATGNVQAIPEPASLALGGVALAAMACFAGVRRRRSKGV